MKKTIAISINKTPFVLEEDAYERLSAYLSAVKSHFATNPDQSEIIDDIESGIAQHLKEFDPSIITLSDVEVVIKNMGETDQFDDGATEPVTSSPRSAKKLYRDGDQVLIAGVASGLGHYLGIDTTVVRVLFVLTLFFGGVGIILYVLLWILVPEATTAAQKLEMKGEPVTLAMMSKMVKDRIDAVDAKGVIRHGAGGFFRGVGKGIAALFRVLVPLVRITTGIVLTIVGFAGAAGSIIGTGFVLTNKGIITGLLGGGLETLIGSTAFIIAICALALVLLIPFLFIIGAGMSILRARRRVSRLLSLPLLAVWFVAIIIVGISISHLVIKASSLPSTVEIHL